MTDNMCQAPVGKVLSVDGGKLKVKYKGKTLSLDSRIPDVHVGDYVMFSLNIAVDKVDKED